MYISKSQEQVCRWECYTVVWLSISILLSYSDTGYNIELVVQSKYVQ